MPSVMSTRTRTKRAQLIRPGFASEEVHTRTLLGLAFLLMSAFVHLLREHDRCTGDISVRRIKDVLRLYAKFADIPGCSEEEIVAALTSVLWLEFRRPGAASRLTYTPETFAALDSESTAGRPVAAGMDELKAWREKGAGRWLFLDNTIGEATIGEGKARRTHELSRQPRLFLQELLLHARFGVVARSNLAEAVRGKDTVLTGSGFREAMSRMHKQTGGLLKRYFSLGEAHHLVTIRRLPSYCAIWIPRRN